MFVGWAVTCLLKRRTVLITVPALGPHELDLQIPSTLRHWETGSGDRLHGGIQITQLALYTGRSIAVHSLQVAVPGTLILRVIS